MNEDLGRRQVVLVADDSSTVRKFVSFSLKSHDLDVITAVDGMDALEKLSQTPVVDLIIVDLNMPNMDGLTFVKEVKKTTFKFIPILVLTTESQESKKIEGKEAGASGWLVKPFKPEQLIAVVSKFVK